MQEVDWHGLRELLALRAHFNDFFEKALLPSASPTSGTAAISHEPAVDIWEDDRHLVIEVELPGVSSSQLELRLEEDDLVIGGEAVVVDPPGCSYLRIERPRGRFYRRVTLPAQVVGEPRAELSGGVLTVTLERAAPRRRIPVVLEGEDP